MKYLTNIIFRLIFLIYIPAVLSADSTISTEIIFKDNSGEIESEIVPKNGLDMGKIRPDEKKQCQIAIKNKCRGKISFEEWNSPASCLEFENTVDEISPGEERNIVVILDITGYKGDFSKYMSIGYSGEDGKKQSFFLPIRFYVMNDGEKDEPKKGEPSIADPGNMANDAGRILYFDFDELKKDKEKDIGKFAERGAWIFAAKDCPSCNYLKKNVLPKLFNPEFWFKNFDSSTPCGIITVNLDVKENLLLMLKIEDVLGVKGHKSPVLYWNGALYYGADDIKKLVAGEIKPAKTVTTKTSPLLAALEDKGIDGQKLLDKKAGEITLGVILLAGLADGVNPCVFSTLIFFISLLSVAKVGGRKLVLTGTVYCLACFLACLALGFGLLNFLKVFSGYKSLQSWIAYMTAGILLFLATASFVDAWRYHRSENAASVKLQLPGKVKELIHRKIGASTNKIL